MNANGHKCLKDLFRGITEMVRTILLTPTKWPVSLPVQLGKMEMYHG